MCHWVKAKNITLEQLLQVLLQVFMTLFLKYSLQLWFPPFLKYVRKLDTTQARATRVIRLLKVIPYSEKVRKLNLFSY